MSGGSIPPFSIFSAVSELLVTAGVFTIVRRNWTGRGFSLGLFLALVLFEALVNVLYMANRAAQAAAGVHMVSPGLRMMFAAHGILSLVALLVFIVLGVFAYQEQKQGRSYFREHPALTWVFLVVWTVSVASGEAIFALRYLV